MSQIGNFLSRSWNSFNDAQCYHIASALTYYTILSLVPILAMAFGIALTFGVEKYVESEIQTQLIKQPELAESIIEFAYSFLERARGGIIAAIGSLALLWTTFTLLVALETTCNIIWDVKQSRRIRKQIVHYLGLIFLAPLLFVLISSSFVVLTAHITLFHTLISLIISEVIIWALFLFIYLYMPHTHVPFIPALFSAIIAGSLNHLWYWAIIKFQVGITGYGAIYGSFAAVPLFLIWIQVSWTILLLGVVLSRSLSPK